MGGVKQLSQPEQLRLYTQILESSACGVLITDSKQRDNPIVYVNPAFETLTCYPLEEVEGRNPRFLLADDRDQPFVIEMEAAITLEKKCHGKLRNYRKDGSMFWNRLTLSPVFDDDSELSYFIGILDDVTAEQELQETNQRLQSEISVRKQIEQAQGANLRYLEKMRRVVEAIGQSPDPEQWLAKSVVAVREVFQADRAWLLYPCDPESSYWEVPVESATDAYPGLFSHGERLPMNDEARQVMSDALNSSVPVIYAKVNISALVEKFNVKSQMFMAIRPRIGKPWVLGLHQCSDYGSWSEEDQRLFKDIGARIEEVFSCVALHKELKEREERLRLLLESTEEGIYGIDADGNCTFANPASAALLGYENVSDLIGKNMRDLTDFSCPGALPHLPDSCAKCQVYTEGKSIAWEGGEFQMADGSRFPVEFHCSPIRHDEHIDGATVTFVNISERKKYEEKIWRQANFDALTGLPTRTLFMDRLAQAINVAKREQHSVALMYIDLDRFKWVNDTLGHDAGDRLLIEAANRLKMCARESDTVARLGGDEFIVILPSVASERNVEQVAEKMLANLLAPFHLSDHNESFVSGTIGIALFPQDAEDATTLLRNADMAMYKAKQDGRNTYAFFTEEMNYAAQEHTRVERELHRALENNELMLYYQPLMDLRTQKVMGAEALIRWRHPERGLVYPADFIPLAEETGLILTLGEWVLDQVVQQLEVWCEKGLVLTKISINVSARQCLTSGFLKHLESVLARCAFPVETLGLVIEVTEAGMLEHVDEIIECLTKIRSLGVSLVLDDFGAGYTSLIELKRFPVEAIKIDCAFVQNITVDAKDAGLTRAVISMSHNLGMKVVAEGIETAAQLEFLQHSGCDFGQGFYFSKPLPANLFEAFLGED